MTWRPLFLGTALVVFTAAPRRPLDDRDAIREDAFIADSAMTYLRTPDDIDVNSKWPIAYERGHWVGVPRNSAEQTSLSGLYSAQWIKVSGKWLIRSELFVALWCTGQACDWPVVTGR